MIILFDEAEKSFTSLGLGILRDAIDCTVKESLNDSFEFEMTYPITGSNYSKIRIGRIICAKPNPYDDFQPFRIYSISKPLKGIVTVTGYHISYDMNGIPVKAIDATGLNDALTQIQNGAYISSDFNLKTNISAAKTFKTTAPYNMRAILMGDEDESLLGVYDGEVKFDKFDVTIYSKRGKNRGAQVCYGENMTDLTHETNVDRLYNKVFPYYHKETTSTETVTEDKFTQVYVVGSKVFQDGWLSYSKDGEAYHPLDATPVQIATEGDYYEKVYAWNITHQRYDEKIYNESVSLIEGVVSPTWIVIDWSKFPTVTCRANAKGYFKSSTDDDWGDIKGVGDVIFSGNVLSGGLSGMASNMLIYYAEVVPASSTSESKEVSEVVDVILDEPIINIETSDAKAMKFDRVLSLDLTSEFDEEPSKDKLKAKAEEYISKNKVGTVNHNTTVSFIDLSTTTEKDKYKNFDRIELGDTVRVIYKDLGVDVELRAISTDFNVITGRYNSVELGVKDDTLSSQSIQNGDSISSLTNDVGYADITTVNKLIADTITAEFIQAVNAKLTQAQIQELSVAKINCSGIIEASQFTLDELVAKLLVADNAKIAETLEAGNIKVAGDITVNSGEITIEGSNGTTFRVDRDGNVTANSVEITGGTLNINDGVFEVQNDGTVTCQAIQITGGEFNINDGTFEVDNDGKVICKSINITGGSFNINDKFTVDEEGNMTATSGNIAGFTIQDGSLYYKISSFNDDTKDEGVYIGTDGIRLGKNFTVDKTGQVKASGLKIDLTPAQKTELKGEPGTSITMKSSIDECTEIGDSYIDNDENSVTYGHLLTVSATDPTITFTDGGNIKGKQGIPGEPGQQGDPGTSVTVKASESECTEIGDSYIVQDTTATNYGHLMILTTLDPRTFTDGGQIKGDQGDIGYGIVTSVSRANFTESDWGTYGTIGHEETWDGTESLRNNCRIGDLFTVVGESTDKGNSHTLTYRSTTSSGNLHGVCQSHSITEKGDPGNPGDPGDSAYVHIKYAPTDDVTKDDMIETPDKYIGIYTDHNPTDSTTKSDYAPWGQFKGDQGIQGINGTSEGYLYHLDSASAYTTKPTGINDSNWSSTILFPTSEKPYCYSSQYTKKIADATTNPITYSYEFTTPVQHSTLEGMLTLLSDGGVNIISKVDGKYVVNADKLKGAVSKAVEIAGFQIDETSLQNGTPGNNEYIGISSAGLYRNCTTMDYNDIYSFDTVSGYTYKFERNAHDDTDNYYCYRSTNYNINSSYAVTKITFLKDAKNVKIGIRSYAESHYDYTIISELNVSAVPTVSSASGVKAHTSDNQQSGTSESDYTFVTYESISAGDYIYVVYRKDGSTHANDDRGYLLFPKVFMFLSTSVVLAGEYFRVDKDGYISTTYGKIGNLDISKSGQVYFDNGQMILGTYSTDQRLPVYSSYFNSARINTFVSGLQESDNDTYWVTLSNNGLESYHSDNTTPSTRHGQIPINRLQNIMISASNPSYNTATNRYIKVYSFVTSNIAEDSWQKYSLSFLFKRILAVVATCCGTSASESLSGYKGMCMVYFTSNSEGNCDVYIGNDGSGSRPVSVIIIGEASN